MFIKISDTLNGLIGLLHATLIKAGICNDMWRGDILNPKTQEWEEDTWTPFFTRRMDMIDSVYLNSPGSYYTREDLIHLKGGFVAKKAEK